jgi:hypothetical protein
LQRNDFRFPGIRRWQDLDHVGGGSLLRENRLQSAFTSAPPSPTTAAATPSAPFCIGFVLALVTLIG